MADQLYHCVAMDITGKRKRHWIGGARNESHARLQANKVLGSDPRHYDVNRLAEANDVVHVQLWIGNERG